VKPNNLTIKRQTMRNNSSNMDMQIDSQFVDAIDVDAIKQQVQRTLAAVAANRPANLTIVITSDQTIQQLHREYLGIDEPTDVLTFSQTEGDRLPEESTDPYYLGDVVVSYERAADQAGEYGEPIERELCRLVVHGTLHLLGYNDLNERARAKMWELQENLLAH
jgi:probable rRNA maturation factor